jgi:DNA repair exonuclease SbcCD ATPase subunit
MKIHKFTAKNFGPFESISMETGGMLGVWMVNGINHDRPGNNGVGKSTFYDPIFYGLVGSSIESMGKGREINKTLSDLVLDDNEKRSMQVEIWVDDKRIIRGHKPKKFQVYQINNDGTETDITSTASQETLEREWGINLQTLSYIFRFGGGETGLSGYIGGGIEFHRRIQDTLIQVDRITRYLEVARSLVNKLVKDRHGLDRDLIAANERCDSLISEIKKFEFDQLAESNRINDVVNGLNGQISKIESFDLDLHERLRNELDLLEKEIDSKREAVNSMVDKINELLDLFKVKNSQFKDKKEKLTSLQDDFSGLAVEELAEKSRLKTEFYFKKKEEASKIESMINRAEEIKIKISVLQKRIVEKKHSAGKYNDEINSKMQYLKVESLDVHMNELDSCNESIDSVNSDISIIKVENESLQKSVSLETTISSFIIEKRKGIDDRKYEIKCIDDEIEKIRNMEEGSKCPTCYSDITHEHVGHAIEVIEARKAPHLKHIENANAELLDLEHQISKIREKKDKFESNNKKLSSLNDEISRLSKYKESLNLKIENIKTRQKLAITSKERIDELEKLKADFLSDIESANNEIDSLNKDLEKIKDVDGTILKEVKDAKAESDSAALRLENEKQRKFDLMANIKSMEESIEKLAKERKELKEAIDKLDGEEEEARSELKSLKEELGKFMFEDGEPPMSIKAIDKCKNELKMKKDELEKALAMVNPYDSIIENKKSVLDSNKESLKQVEDKIAEIDDEMPYLEFWKQGFGPDGIRPMAMRELLPIVNKQVQRWMLKLPGNQVGVEFDNTFSIKFFDIDTRAEAKYSKISSGMKMRVNIAVALAFRDVISASTGCHVPIFVSDEGLESLDEEGMAGYFDCLEEIGKDTLVILINHNKYMKELAEQKSVGIIKIEHKDKKSTLEIE